MPCTCMNGRLAFDVRVDGNVTRILSEHPAPKSFQFKAELNEENMILHIDGREVARGPSPGLIPVQPKDPQNIGRDELSSAGDYEPPNPLQGQVTELRIATQEPGATDSTR